MTKSEMSFPKETARAPLHCTYHKGMFSYEPYRGGYAGELQFLKRPTAVAVHEAGHAVVGYALGFGCAALSMIRHCGLTPVGEVGYGYSGEADLAKGLFLRAKTRIDQGDSPAILVRGVCDCAGPAAERKFNYLHGLPQQGLDTAECDHTNAQHVGRHLPPSHSIDGYQRLSWWFAQRAVDNEAIWEAISWIAEELEEALEWPDDMKPGDQTESTVDGRRARAMMHRAGVRPGMLGIRLG